MSLEQKNEEDANRSIDTERELEEFLRYSELNEGPGSLNNRSATEILRLANK